MDSVNIGLGSDVLRCDLCAENTQHTAVTIRDQDGELIERTATCDVCDYVSER